MRKEEKFPTYCDPQYLILKPVLWERGVQAQEVPLQLSVDCTASFSQRRSLNPRWTACSRPSYLALRYKYHDLIESKVRDRLKDNKQSTIATFQKKRLSDSYSQNLSTSARATREIIHWTISIGKRYYWITRPALLISSNSRRTWFAKSTGSWPPSHSFQVESWMQTYKAAKEAQHTVRK